MVFEMLDKFISSFSIGSSMKTAKAREEKMLKGTRKDASYHKLGKKPANINIIIIFNSSNDNSQEHFRTVYLSVNMQRSQRRQFLRIFF